MTQTDTNSSLQEEIEYQIHWPQWTLIYMRFVALPMGVIAFSVFVWIMLTDFGGMLTERPTLQIIILEAPFAVTFISISWLFFGAFQRTHYHKPEALLLAATGHLLFAIPAMVYLMITFARNPSRFLDDFAFMATHQQAETELFLMIWMVIQAYIALFLALADHTNETAFSQHNTTPQTTDNEKSPASESRGSSS